MHKVRIGVVGIGNMGSRHSQYLSAGEVQNAELAAVCDINSQRLQWAKQTFGDQLALFQNAETMFASRVVDAVIIATPHYSHPSLAIEAIKQGLHVLIEKPAGVYTSQVNEMNECALTSNKVFGIMLNQRTRPIYQKLREMIFRGELGDIKRINWIITDWYRPQSYYDSGEWRATWKGEGGGVLLNQSPHQLDLLQWIFDIPIRVRAFCSFGKYHNIEVEDDVTAYLEYKSGATGVFITSTGDCPGTNRLEISADNGKVVVEDNKITFWRLSLPERQFNREWKGGFNQPDCSKYEIPVDTINGSGHCIITDNWVKAILNGSPLLAPGSDGIKGVQLANAMLLSTWTNNWVDIPFDEEKYYELLDAQIINSSISKRINETRTLDIGKSF